MRYRNQVFYSLEIDRDPNPKTNILKPFSFFSASCKRRFSSSPSPWWTQCVAGSTLTRRSWLWVVSRTTSMRLNVVDVFCWLDVERPTIRPSLAGPCWRSLLSSQSCLIWPRTSWTGTPLSSGTNHHYSSNSSTFPFLKKHFRLIWPIVDMCRHL